MFHIVLFNDFTLHKKQFNPDYGTDELSVLVWICNMTNDGKPFMAHFASKLGMRGLLVNRWLNEAKFTEVCNSCQNAGRILIPASSLDYNKNLRICMYGSPRFDV